MYWRVEDLPELQHLSPENRRRLVRECIGRARFLQWVVTWGVLGTGCGIWVSLLVAHLVGIRAGYEIWLVGPMVLAATVVLHQVRLIQIRGQLLIYLERIARQQRLPMCLGCGYDLTGLTGDTCPECGLRIPAGGREN